MKNTYVIQIISYVALLIFTYLFVYNFFYGITSQPTEGDSIHYHIPVANFYLTGQILNPPDKEMIIHWYPSASESILALFLLLHIPLNLYNVLSTLLLFFVCFLLGKEFLKEKYLSLLFAASMVTTHGILRMQHTQNIDVWMAIFFILSLLLLHTPQKTAGYFLKLGFCLGMVVGSKYSGPLLALALLLVYGKNLFNFLNFKRIIIFLIPFLTVGAVWYIRNFILTGSPVYPQGFLFLSGYEAWEKMNFSFLDYPMWRSFITLPQLTFSAFISEYMLWTFNLLIIPFMFVYYFFYKQSTNKKSQVFIQTLKPLLLVTIISYIFFFMLPGGDEYKHIVLGIRYSFGPFIISVLCIFLLAKHFKFTDLISYLVIANMILLPPLTYHPKLLFVYIPIVIIIYFTFMKTALKKQIN